MPFEIYPIWLMRRHQNVADILIQLTEPLGLDDGIVELSKNAAGSNMFLNESRKEYTKYDFDKSRALDNPFQQFPEWFEFAEKNAVFEPNAMHISTVDEAGALKIVLCY